MRLVDLAPGFLRYERVGPDEFYSEVATLAEADGVVFLCPKCYRTHGGPVGVHAIICWTPRVSPDVSPKPGRWNFVGTGFGDLSLIAGSSSILLTSGCQWHGFIRNGEAIDA